MAKPELLAPAGGFDAAVAAFQFGADAVYLGLPSFSARADAENMGPERLEVLLAYARSFSPAKKVYITFNTLVKESELAKAVHAMEVMDSLGPDGVIVQDLGVAALLHRHFPKLDLHASTQLAVHNVEGVKALKRLGFTRAVLARELSLEEIKRIVDEGGLEIEIFIHGALCYSMSGLCLFSSLATGRSGNRGRCAYCCREAFQVQGERGTTFPFSMKDLALGPIMDKVLGTGAHSLKIEGRMKSPYYVACVTDYYRKRIDRLCTPEEDAALVQDLQSVFSRPWTRLYAEGIDRQPESVIDPIGMGHRGARIGTVRAIIRDRDNSYWLRFRTDRALEKHDGIQIELPSGGKPYGFAILGLRRRGSRGVQITVPARCEVEVRLPDHDVPPLPKGSVIFCSASQAVKRRYEASSVRESTLPIGQKAGLRIELRPDALLLHAESEAHPEVIADLTLSAELPPAAAPEKSLQGIQKALSRTGGSGWRLSSLTCENPRGLYASPSLLNRGRRELLVRLTQAEKERIGRHERATLGAISAPIRTPVSHPLLRTLKLRLDQPVCRGDARADRLVIDIGHHGADEVERSLRRARTQVGEEKPIRLALPLLTRLNEARDLDRTLSLLSERGYKDWECADLAGFYRLRELGITPASSDWTLYVFNHILAERLGEEGISSFVTPPELDAETLEDLAKSSPVEPELLLFQHTPAFISETRPCTLSPSLRRTESLPLENRRKENFTVFLRDGRWITVSGKPFSAIGTPLVPLFSSQRIDLSWTPAEVDREALCDLIFSDGIPLPSSSANLSRPLL